MAETGCCSARDRHVCLDTHRRGSQEGERMKEQKEQKERIHQQGQAHTFRVVDRRTSFVPARCASSCACQGMRNGNCNVDAARTKPTTRPPLSTKSSSVQPLPLPLPLLSPIKLSCPSPMHAGHDAAPPRITKGCRFKTVSGAS
jgi:hypothetical protein